MRKRGGKHLDHFVINPFGTGKRECHFGTEKTNELT